MMVCLLWRYPLVVTVLVVLFPFLFLVLFLFLLLLFAAVLWPPFLLVLFPLAPVPSVVDACLAQPFC